MDFLGLLRPILGLFGVPLLVTLPTTIGLWLLVGEPMPEFLLLPIALLLTPSLWLGLILAIFLSRYFSAAGKSSALRRVRVARRSSVPSSAVDDRVPSAVDEPAPSAVDGSARDARSAAVAMRALKRLDRAYRIREVFARSWLRNAVYIGYLMKYGQLRTKLTGHPLDAHRGAGEEQNEIRIRERQALFCKICEFVSVTGIMGPRRSEALIEEFLAMLPDTPSRPMVTDVVRTTFHDGAGFLSTLTVATYVQFAQDLPAPLRLRFDTVLVQLDFEPRVYGWLSNRVIEALVYLCAAGTRTAEEIRDLLQPVLSGITQRLTACTDQDEALHAKWDGRAQLRAAAGITSRT